MKIERLSDNQMRFTLTGEDLARRKMKLSELTYGSEKARALFQEMMQQAADDYGFDAANVPLLVEAIPVSADQLILVVTKVDNPDELDSRFARFSPEDTAKKRSESSSLTELVGADEILELIKNISQAARKAADAAGAASAGKPKELSAGTAGKTDGIKSDEKQAADESDQTSFNLSRFYLFHNLETVIRAAKAIGTEYAGPSSLFRNDDDGNYYLIIKKAETSAELFNSVCNILSEYGMQVDYSDGMEEFFREHMIVIVVGNALGALARL